MDKNYAPLAAAVVLQAMRDAYGRWGQDREGARAFLAPDSPMLDVYATLLGTNAKTIADMAARHGARVVTAGSRTNRRGAGNTPRAVAV